MPQSKPEEIRIETRHVERLPLHSLGSVIARFEDTLLREWVRGWKSLRIITTYSWLAVAVCVFAAGCSKAPVSSQADSTVVEEKLDEILSMLRASTAVPVTAENEDDDQLATKLDQILTRLPATASDIDTSTLSRESTTDLAWILITSDPSEKKELVTRRIEQSSEHGSVTAKNIQAIVTDLEGLNLVITTPEHLDVVVLQQAEEARNRLASLLREEIPGIVLKLDEQAVKSENYSEARRLWAQSSAVLGFYPSSNDPTEAGRIQDLVSGHDVIRTRIDLGQQQRYNLWACQQIRKAWKDFEENSDAGARMQTCLHFLGPIHPGLLDPVSLELYRDFLQTIRSKVSKDVYQGLAEDLAVERRKLIGET